MQQYNIQAVSDQLLEFYELSLDEDTLLTYCLSALRHIGNQNIRLRLMKAKTKKDENNGGWYVEKPCNLMTIEAITLPFFESAKSVSSIDNYLLYKTEDIERWIEVFKNNKSPYYISGMFVKYTEAGDRIYFTLPYEAVDILYKEEMVDNDGLPYINGDDELEACTHYCAFAYENRKGHAKKDANMIQLAQQAYQYWILAKKRATVQYMSQNQWNEVLDVLSSWGGSHSHNVTSTKPLP